MRRVIAWAAGIAAMTGVSAAMLMTTVPGDRGRDEINLVTIHELPLPSGGVLTQAVPLQRASPYDIRLPYHWRGERPARVEVQLTGADGVLLADNVESLGDSRAPLWLQPFGDGSIWQHERAAFRSIRLPPTAGGSVVLRLTRIDQEPGMLVFFASDRLPPPSGDTRPTLVEKPSEFLDLETEYGTPGRAIAKTPVYISRLHTLTPPWMPFPVPELLLGLIAAAGIYLFTVLLFSPPRSR